MNFTFSWGNAIFALTGLLAFVLSIISMIGAKVEAPENIRVDEKVWTLRNRIADGIFALAYLCFAVSEVIRMFGVSNKVTVGVLYVTAGCFVLGLVTRIFNNRKKKGA